MEFYRTMVRIRTFEEKAAECFTKGMLAGNIHLSIGQEAAEAGAFAAIEPKDYFTSTHRGHGHAIARGADPKRAMAELFGKKTGYCKGKGGSMHIADMEKMNHLGANGIVGGGQPISAGSALASWILGDDSVTVGCFGDGATNEGSYHETMNAVGLWKLPVIYVCENNLFSANTSIKLTCCQENVAAGRAEVYGIPSEVVDGNDVMAVNEAATRAIARARAGEGATILELKTYRHGGHSRNDACGYRAKDEEKAWIQDKDPVKMFRARILDEGAATEDELQKMEADIEAEIDEAVEYAKNAPLPENESALHDVFWEG